MYEEKLKKLYLYINIHFLNIKSFFILILLHENSPCVDSASHTHKISIYYMSMVLTVNRW